MSSYAEFYKMKRKHDDLYINNHKNYEPYLTHMSNHCLITTDYIFYSGNSFDVNGVLKLPPVKML